MNPSDDRKSDRPVAIVSGAARGIGLGIARALACTGHRVALADLDADGAAASAVGLPDAIGVPLDVADLDSWLAAVAAVVARWGRVDVLVNNAGIFPRGTAESTDLALWERTMAINLRGPWLGIKACLPELRRSRGAIINIGSSRSTRPLRGLFAYVVSKAGLLGLTQQVAIEYLADGIACNMVAPGWTDTPGERDMQTSLGRPDFPAGIDNLTTPDEVGAAVAYLASPAGRRANGTIIYVDSGYHVAEDSAMVHQPGSPPFQA